MEPNWMLARRKLASVERRAESLHSPLKSESDTLRVLSDKARLLWRLRGMRSLGCAVHFSEVPAQAVRSTPSCRYQGIEVATSEGPDDREDSAQHASSHRPDGYLVAQPWASSPPLPVVRGTFVQAGGYKIAAMYRLLHVLPLANPIKTHPYLPDLLTQEIRSSRSTYLAGVRP